MRINRIELYNFRNHHSTCVDLDNINVFVGRNNSGKSSIKAAIEYALTGRCQDWTDGAGRGADSLISHGSTNAVVKLGVEGIGAITREIPNNLQVGGWHGNLKLQQEQLLKELNAGADVISSVINTGRFISMKPDEQKNMLFALMGLVFNKDSIREELGNYLDDIGKAEMMDEAFCSYIERWISVSTSDGPEVLDSIHKTVYTERTTVKKSLKELEALASGKPESSLLPSGAFETREQIKADLLGLKGRKEELLQQRGQAKARQSLVDHLESKLLRLVDQKAGKEKELSEIEFDPEELKKVETKLPSFKSKAEDVRNRLEIQRNLIAGHQANLNSWMDARDNLNKKHDWTCPLVPGLTCAADKTDILKKVEKDINAVAGLLEKARDEEALIEKDRKTANANYEHTLTRVNELRQTDERVRRLAKDIEELDREYVAVKEEFLDVQKEVFATDEIDAELGQLSQRLANGEDLMQKIAAEEAVRKERDRIVNALARKKKEVEWLEVLVEAFGPKGLKAIILARVIGSLQDLVNKRLDMLTCGRYSVEFNIDKGFEILVTAGNVTTCLPRLSTSERMRIGIVLQDALNGLTGLRLMVIDDCEILDPQNKQLLIGMLLQIKDSYDTIIVLSALGETAPRNPGVPGLTVYMVEDGNVRLIPVAQAA